ERERRDDSAKFRLLKGGRLERRRRLREHERGGKVERRRRLAPRVEQLLLASVRRCTVCVRRTPLSITHSKARMLNDLSAAVKAVVEHLKALAKTRRVERLELVEQLDAPLFLS